jgi:hypothetical protein
VTKAKVTNKNCFVRMSKQERGRGFFLFQKPDEVCQLRSSSARCEGVTEVALRCYLSQSNQSRNSTSMRVSQIVFPWKSRIAGLNSSIDPHKIGVKGSAYRCDFFLAKAFEASELTGVVDGFVLAPKVHLNFCRLADRQRFLQEHDIRSCQLNCASQKWCKEVWLHLRMLFHKHRGGQPMCKSRHTSYTHGRSSQAGTLSLNCSSYVSPVVRVEILQTR